MTGPLGNMSGSAPCAQTTTALRPLSPRVGSGPLSGRPFDLHHYRRVFPDRWMMFLHGHFSGPIEVQYMFSVSERTARKWWNGQGSPRAEFALACCKHIPGAFEMLTEAA